MTLNHKAHAGHLRRRHRLRERTRFRTGLGRQIGRASGEGDQHIDAAARAHFRDGRRTRACSGSTRYCRTHTRRGSARARRSSGGCVGACETEGAFVADWHPAITTLRRDRSFAATRHGTYDAVWRVTSSLRQSRRRNQSQHQCRRTDLPRSHPVPSFHDQRAFIRPPRASGNHSAVRSQPCLDPGLEGTLCHVFDRRVASRHVSGRAKILAVDGYRPGCRIRWQL